MRISDWSSDVCSSDRTLRLTGLHRREHARCIAILHRARQPRWWQLCPALAVIDPGPAAVLTDLIIEVTSEPQLRRIQNGRCVEHRLGWLALDPHRRTTRPAEAGPHAADRLPHVPDTVLIIVAHLVKPAAVVLDAVACFEPPPAADTT